MTEEDDWFYGSDMRLDGGKLVKNGATLLEDKRGMLAEEAVKIRKIEDDLRDFTDMKQTEIDDKRSAFESQYEEEKAVVMEEADQRVQELMQMKKEKEVEFMQEEKLARERDGAASSSLISSHREHLQEMDRIREAERDRMIGKQEEKEARARQDFDTEEAIAVS